MWHPDDTIVAIASPRGGGLRGVLRVSGPRSQAIIEQCFRESAGPTESRKEPEAVFAWPARSQVRSARLRLADLNRFLPGELYVWPTHRSYTGQPCAEFHTCGSPPLLESSLRTLRAAGARLAEPGEFTLRAFLAGRMDLTQAEAVLGVIDAADASQAETALHQLAGGIGRPIHELRDRLLNLLADVEAGLDFVEDDIEFVTAEHLLTELRIFEEQVVRMLERMRAREMPQQSFRVALTGRPNVGKSSLLNALAGEPVAIVADQAGTTRDYLERACSLGGRTCTLIDTAGRIVGTPVSEPSSSTSALRDAAPSTVDAASERFAAAQVEQADVELFCIDATRPPDAWETAQLAQDHPARLVVFTKCDRIGNCVPTGNGLLPVGLATSSKTGLGLTELQAAIVKLVESEQGEAQGVVASTASRCFGSLQAALDSLRSATDAVHTGAGDELIAFELRQAANELGLVAGVVYTDDILDRVFSRFCIGK